MRKFFLLVVCSLLLATTASAVPAYPYPSIVRQPDGTTVTLRQNGDEYLNFITTTDGYTVVRDGQGYYVYARKVADGSLKPTSVIAHDAKDRNDREASFLATTQRMLVPAMNERVRVEQQAEQARRVKAIEARRANGYDYSKFHGLIILVEYSDMSFMYSNYAEIMEGLVNQEGYKGTKETNFRNYNYGINAQCYGSVHDYYKDNSNGIFSPKFDIIGPVKVNRSSTYVKKTENCNQLMKDVLTAADSQVDYSNYDTDGDGVVDMVYFIFAGPGSHDSTNDQNLLWPHASELYDTYSYWSGAKPLVKDGITFGRYACGTELEGPSWLKMLDGIGTMCHEFSHVLGLPDFYDVDYEDQGLSNHPGEWSVMAGGNYGNYGRTPVGYSLYERAFLGFLPEPAVLSAEGAYTIEDLSTTGQGYRINTPVQNEYFLLENRQRNGWDTELPGHGMLVHRVDKTNSGVWNMNTVNCNPKHMYYEMLFADGYKTDKEGYAVYSGADPFPGTKNVTSLSNVTSPANLKSWAGKDCVWALENIKESNGVISFDVVDVNVLKAISLPETYQVWLGTAVQLVPVRTPDYAPYTLAWKSDNTDVAVVGQDGYVTGISEGTARITVTANNVLTATCTVQVSRADMAESIGSLCGQPEGSERLLLLNEAQVVYVNKNNAYVRDASGSIVFANMGGSLAKGDQLSGHIYVRTAMVNGIPQATAVEGVTNFATIVVTKGDEVQPVVIRVSDTSSHYYANLLTLKGFSLSSETITGSIKRAVARDGERMVLLTNPFSVPNLKMPSTTAGKLFEVTGIFGTEVVEDQTYDAIYMLSKITEADMTPVYSAPLSQGRIVTSAGELRLSGFAASAPLTVYAADGRQVTQARMQADGTLSLPLHSWPSGIYLLRIDGQTVKFLKQ